MKHYTTAFPNHLELAVDPSHRSASGPMRMPIRQSNASYRKASFAADNGITDRLRLAR